MNEVKKTKTEKLGADGLSKKERRALKVSQKIPTDDANKDVVVNKVVNICDGGEKKLLDGVVKENNDIGKGLSKKERRALKVAEAGGNAERKVGEVVKAEKKIVGAKISAEVTNNSDKIKSTHVKIKTAEAQINSPEIGAKNSDTKIESAENVMGKSKSELRAERRELQEKQRLAKLAAAENKAKKPERTGTAVVKKPSPTKASPKQISCKKEFGPSQVQLFNHLHFEQLNASEKGIVHGVHPSFIRIGAQYASKTILGSNARCLVLLSALKDLVEDFTTPPNQELCRSLETYLQTSTAYLQKCRPFAVSMMNALRHFKVHLTQIKTDLPDSDKKLLLLKFVDTYVQDEIHTAGRAISMKVSEKIVDGDVILTYGCSSLIKKILIDAHTQGSSFRVIVIDGRPLLEGREMLRKLINAGIDCSYTMINAGSFIMGQVTKVLLGAHALLANGYVMARTGTAQVALIAKAHNKPVLVCCETYKFCERVQTDSFVYNEIGDSEKMKTVDTSGEDSPLCNLKGSNFLTLLNLMYDVTPPDLVTAVVTELGFLPCTSVPVILRIKPTE